VVRHSTGPSLEGCALAPLDHLVPTTVALGPTTFAPGPATLRSPAVHSSQRSLSLSVVHIFPGQRTWVPQLARGTRSSLLARPQFAHSRLSNAPVGTQLTARIDRILIGHLGACRTISTSPLPNLEESGRGSFQPKSLRVTPSYPGHSGHSPFPLSSSRRRALSSAEADLRNLTMTTVGERGSERVGASRSVSRRTHLSCRP
jgi:hypothetical protein